MAMHRSRRRFLQSTALGGGAMLGLANLGFLDRLRPVVHAETKLNPDAVRLRPEIEPLVRVIESTSRDRLLEEIAGRINEGLSYREILAALLLAGVRNVEPRPSVGFKFHCVLAVNSAHLASMAGPASDRWLPIFWALDNFKQSQKRDEQQRGWTMAPVDESAVPPPRKARRALVEAMEKWDAEAADAAAAGLVRSAGAHEVFELMFRYGARDFRSIGHKAIFAANSYRTLQAIGWHHAEPVVRSLVYALLNHSGEPNPAKNDLSPDRPWRRNRELVERFNADWRGGNGEDAAGATKAMLRTLRMASAEEASERVIEHINAGVAPDAIWDALFDGAGEQLMRQPGIVALHAMTTTNAIHQAYRLSGDDRTRRLLLLQNAAFLTRFRGAMSGRGDVGDRSILQLEPIDEEAKAQGDEALEAIFGDLDRDRSAAARRALAYLRNGGEPGALIDHARRLLFVKGNDPHDYKFTSAVLEDYYHISPAWRNRYLAASLFRLCGADQPDNQLVQRTRAALAG